MNIPYVILVSLFLGLTSTTVQSTAPVTSQSSNQTKPRAHPALAIKGYNYTNRPIGKVRIEDEFGNKATLISIKTGGSFGPVCCVSFKGDKLSITWERSAVFFDSNPKQMLPRSANTTIPQYDAKLAQQITLHIFPDENIKIEIADKKSFLGSDDKFRITDITRQLWFGAKDLYANPRDDEEEVIFRLRHKVAEAVGDGWTKYQVTDFQDLLYYSYWKIAGLNFEIHPKVQLLLKNADKNPGAFGAFMENLPKNFGAEVDAIEAKQEKQASKK